MRCVIEAWTFNVSVLFTQEMIGKYHRCYSRCCNRDDFKPIDSFDLCHLIITLFCSYTLKLYINTLNPFLNHGTGP